MAAQQFAIVLYRQGASAVQGDGAAPWRFSSTPYATLHLAEQAAAALVLPAGTYAVIEERYV